MAKAAASASRHLPPSTFAPATIAAVPERDPAVRFQHEDTRFLGVRKELTTERFNAFVVDTSGEIIFLGWFDSSIEAAMAHDEMVQRMQLVRASWSTL